jgi:hypothetical protein
MTKQTKRITASDLKYQHELSQGGNFFSRASMKFFGDTMGNYGVRAATVTVKRSNGELVECYELYRRKPVKCGLWDSAYFSCSTFERIHGELVGSN